MKNLELSLFNGFLDKTPKQTTLLQVVETIRSDKRLQVLTENHRRYLAKSDEEAAQREKRYAPCFAVAVQFDGGKAVRFIKGWTGLSLVDFDDVPPERMDAAFDVVCRDIHTVLAYRTLSGQGLRVVFGFNSLPPTGYSPYKQEENINGELSGGDNSLPPAGDSPYKQGENINGELSVKCSPYKQEESFSGIYKVAFLQGNAYYAELTGLPTDGQCKNPTRLSGMAHDPQVFFRPEATPFTVSLPQKKRPGRPKGKRPYALDEVLDSVLDELSERGIAYLPGHHNEYIMQACYLLNRYGVPQAEVMAWASTEFADYGVERVSGIVRSCYNRTEEHATRSLLRKKERTEVATVARIQEYLKERDIRIRHNVITRKQELFDAEKNLWEEMTDTTENSLYCRFCIETGMRMNIGDLRAVINSDFFPSFHPFQSYLAALPPWDGVDYIEQLANRVHVTGCSQELHNRFFKKWFVALLPTWVEDVVNHEILTYIGRQGIYKSTFMRLLLPPELQPYFAARNFAQRLNKDDKLELTEMGLVALEELDHMRPSEVNQLKAITSQHYMNERAVYGRHKERRQHIASFCGTGNNPQFLNDPTGNRRWLPFLVENIDSPLLHPVNYTGLYSQALALWKDGFCYWFTHEDNAELELHNRQFEEPNVEEELILTYFRKPMGNEIGEFLTATRIVELINGAIKTQLSTKSIAFAMNKLGFEKRRTNSARGWNVVILSGEEIKNRQKLHALESNFD